MQTCSHREKMIETQIEKAKEKQRKSKGKGKGKGKAILYQYLCDNMIG